jgi:AcrR family transcriptional regulator
MATRSGRRPGDSGARAAIAEAARRQFALAGYDRATMRGIAAEAGVDPALISHYYGSKRQLFASVVELPVDPAAAVPALLSGPPETLGDRMIRMVLGVLEDERARSRLIGLIRAGASEPEAARIMRERFGEELLTVAAEQLESDQPRLRAALVNSLIMGLVMSRYIVRIEPLASASPDQIAAALGPVLQRYVMEPLGGNAG